MSNKFLKLSNLKLAIIGLGYVGLPLAVEFNKKFKVVGYDNNEKRINDLRSFNDRTLEVSSIELKNANNLLLTCDPQDLKSCNCFIITVPTPIDKYKQPDLSPLVSATSLVGGFLKAGDVVIYESTVYPGATEEVCVPLLEAASCLIYNKEFYVGYSPERVNPGDKSHRIASILKVTSGSTPDALDFVDDLYNTIVDAGTHKAPNIRVAEAAKVIENTQRDINIALVNELALIFNKLGIDTEEVLKAAGTKWNFLPFRPGLVGGHCIGVDPYYLTHKAQFEGYHPEIILAGRRLNDSMGNYVAAQLIQAMTKKGLQAYGSRVLLMGFSFKENCPDMRNTKVIDVIRCLENYACVCDVYDPWVDPEETRLEYGILPLHFPANNTYDAIIVTVAHNEFKEMGAALIRNFGKVKHVLYDLKYILKPYEADLRL